MHVPCPKSQRSIGNAEHASGPSSHDLARGRITGHRPAHATLRRAVATGRGVRRRAAMSTQQVVHGAFVIAEPERLVGAHEALPDRLPSRADWPSPWTHVPVSVAQSVTYKRPSSVTTSSA